MKRFFLASLLFGCALVPALVAGELLLRAVAVDARYIRAMREPHPELGWSLVPGAHFLHAMPEGPVSVHYTSDGRRDDEHSIAKPPGVYRIAVLGDSFMEAYSVALEDAFHRRLEDELVARGVAAETLNFGVSGYATLQEYLLYRSAVRSYSPDLVLVAFFVANDLNGNSLALERSVHTGVQKLLSRPFLRDRDAWEIERVDPQLASQLYASVLARSPVHGSTAAAQSLLVRGVLWRTSRLRDHVFGPSPPSAAVPSRYQPTGDVSLHVVHACEEFPAVSDAWRITEKILARLRDEVRAEGAQLAVFSVPAWEEVDPVRRDQVSRCDAELTRLCLEQAPGYGRLRAIADDLGVPYVDLLDVFRHAARTEGENLFASDEHWSVRGHELAARSVAERLAENGLLPAG